MTIEVFGPGYSERESNVLSASYAVMWRPLLSLSVIRGATESNYLTHNYSQLVLKYVCTILAWNHTPSALCLTSELRIYLGEFMQVGCYSLPPSRPDSSHQWSTHVYVDELNCLRQAIDNRLLGPSTCICREAQWELVKCGVHYSRLMLTEYIVLHRCKQALPLMLCWCVVLPYSVLAVFAGVYVSLCERYICTKILDFRRGTSSSMMYLCCVYLTYIMHN